MGYYQIELEEECIKYTSFVIDYEQYEFLRMPFGLKNAPMVFQQIMNNLLGHLKYVVIYLDDILIFSENLQDHFII